MKTLLTTFLFIALFANHLFSQTSPSELVFNIQVEVSELTPSITLKWNKQTNVQNYNILKKNRADKTFTMLSANRSENDTVFVDTNVVIGAAYEYCVQGAMNVNVSGYVYAGIKLPEVHQAGEILLLIDDTYMLPAALEIEAYKIDLIKEGWKVSTEFVSRTQSVGSVKQIIIDHYNANMNNLKGVILLGHVPIPYSGKIAPDAHSNHIGAWPSDMYYGDLGTTPSAEIWNDISLSIVSASDSRNHNTIGDGKFDASNKSTVEAVKIFVGRIDVYNMPAINADDVFLFKQYLAKNHVYRTGLKKFRQAGIVDDNFGFFGGEAFAQNGWRNFSSLLGANNVEAGDYITSTKANSYLWSYACGAGWYTGSSGVGTTNDFASDQMESVFTMLYGSYFGDWDNQNNFLRAPIASPSASLVSVWGGRPNWFFHTMAMGEPIGYSYINSVDNANTYFPKGYYSNKIHQALHGDPTLKMHMYEAPSAVVTSSLENDTKVRINWTASSDPAVIGYYVYRATDIHDDFTLLNPIFTTDTEFIDESQGFNIPSVYMVKAVKLEYSTTGTYYNLSPGALSFENPLAISLPVNIISFEGVTNANQTNTLYWEVKNEKNLKGYEVQRSANGQEFETIGMVNIKASLKDENSYSFVDTNPLMQASYRLKNIDLDGRFSYSDIISLKRMVITADLTVFPSPFSDQLNLMCSSDILTKLKIQIIDLNGRIILTKETFIDQGQNKIQLSDLDRLRSGMYFVMVTNDENDEMQMIKVMKE